jgi:hypothetical protein
MERIIPNPIRDHWIPPTRLILLPLVLREISFGAPLKLTSFVDFELHYKQGCLCNERVTQLRQIHSNIITDTSDFQSFWKTLAGAFAGNSKVIFGTHNGCKNFVFLFFALIIELMHQLS